MEKRTLEYLCNKFDLKPEDIKWYNSGINYNRIIVTNVTAARKVQEKVLGQEVNGGFLHGAPLGTWTTYDGIFDVRC